MRADVFSSENAADPSDGASKGKVSPVSSSIRDAVEVAEKWLDRIKAFSKDAVVDVTNTAKDTLHKAERVHSLQTEFEARMRRKTTQLDQKLAEFQGNDSKKGKKLERTRDKFLREYISKYQKYLEQYPPLLRRAGEDVLYHRQHLSQVFLKWWEEMEEVSTLVFNTLREVDEEVCHKTNVDMSGLDAFREALQSYGVEDLPMVDTIILPKELNLLRKMDYRRKEEILGLEALVVEGRKEEEEVAFLRDENAKLREKCKELEEELEDQIVPPPLPPESPTEEEPGFDSTMVKRLRAEVEDWKTKCRSKDDETLSLKQELSDLKREVQNMSLRLKLDHFRSNSYSRLRTLSALHDPSFKSTQTEAGSSSSRIPTVSDTSDDMDESVLSRSLQSPQYLQTQEITFSEGGHKEHESVENVSTQQHSMVSAAAKEQKPSLQHSKNERDEERDTVKSCDDNLFDGYSEESHPNDERLSGKANAPIHSDEEQRGKEDDEDSMGSRSSSPFVPSPPPVRRNSVAQSEEKLHVEIEYDSDDEETERDESALNGRVRRDGINADGERVREDPDTHPIGFTAERAL